MLDLAMSRYEIAGMSPTEGTKPGTVGRFIGEIAERLIAKGVTSGQMWERALANGDVQ